MKLRFKVECGQLRFKLGYVPGKLRTLIDPTRSPFASSICGFEPLIILVKLSMARPLFDAWCHFAAGFKGVLEASIRHSLTTPQVALAALKHPP